MKKIRLFWRQLSIKIKLLSYFFIVLSFISLFNLYLNNNNYKIMDQFNNTMTNFYKINSLLLKTEELKTTVEAELRKLDTLDINNYTIKKDEIKALILELFDRFTSLESYFALNAINNSTNVYFEYWDSAIMQRKDLVETYFTDFYRGEYIEIYTENYIEELLYISLTEGTELYNKLVDQAEVMRRISLVLIGGGFLFAMTIGAVFANQVINPIKRLADSSIRISSGDLNVEEIRIDSQDEIGVLADSFNVMSRSIQVYVHDLEQKVIIEKKLHEEELEVLRMEQLLKDSQFQALQSQVNPHFLFNTLNTISRTAMFEEAETTIKLIQALSGMFRYKLRNDCAIIPLKEELVMIEEYIYLQKFRFKERLEYEFFMDEASEAISIPIFTLQPLVENAIIHGIEPKVAGGKVRIKIQSKKREERYYTLIRVTDTGMGMSKERLEEVMKFETMNNRSIGVNNVYHRFMLTFQKNANFKMYSKEGMGTMIELYFERDLLGENNV